MIARVPTPAEQALALLRLARADLKACRVLAADDDLRAGAAFHLQQAWEKGLKAALALAGVGHARTHDLVGLAALLPPGDGLPAAPRDDLEAMGRHAVATRYDPDGPVEPTDRLLAWADGCAALLDAVAARVPQPGDTP